MQNTDQSNDHGKDTTKKESAWKGSSPEDVTGKQNQDPQSGKVIPSQDKNKPKDKNKPQANRPDQDKMKEDDADEMGSGKRQDDN